MKVLHSSETARKTPCPQLRPLKATPFLHVDDESFWRGKQLMGNGGRLQPSDRSSSQQTGTPQLLCQRLLTLSHGVAFALQDAILFGSNFDTELAPLVRHTEGSASPRLSRHRPAGSVPRVVGLRPAVLAACLVSILRLGSGSSDVSLLTLGLLRLSFPRLQRCCVALRAGLWWAMP